MGHSMKVINERGINEIARFLYANHKLVDFDDGMLYAWASEAELHDPPCIEIKAYDSIHGKTQEYYISETGYDTVDIVY